MKIFLSYNYAFCELKKTANNNYAAEFNNPNYYFKKIAELSLNAEKRKQPPALALTQASSMRGNSQKFR